MVLVLVLAVSLLVLAASLLVLAASLLVLAASLDSLLVLAAPARPHAMTVHQFTKCLVHALCMPPQMLTNALHNWVYPWRHFPHH